MRIAIYIIILLSTLASVFAQEAVVSEYYNASSFEDEWTEIIVTADNVNLNNYVLRDNSERYNDGGFWQGGVKFNNHNLWKNLRRGTIIVINHRGNGAADIDPSDGYIEVSSENTAYFTRSSWNGIASLSIQQYGDIIQLQKLGGANVHSLGHVQYSSQGDFFKISGPKIGYVGNCNIGYTISVGNATKLEDYNLNTQNQSGYDTGKSITHHSPSGTKGRANANPKGSPVNYQFWQSIRQPDFNNPRLESIRKDSTVELTWNKITPKPTNDYGGYIIIRTTDIINNECKPLDGSEYYVGQKICVTSEVLAILEGTDHDNFIDENPICGSTTRYSIFAFNFNNGIKSYWNYRDGRGIAYSDNLNPSNYSFITLDPPLEVNIFSRLGNKFCNIDTTVLYTSLSDEEKNEYRYAWFYKEHIDSTEKILIDYQEPGKSDSITVEKLGYYRLEMKGKDGCTSYSDTLHIEIIDQPEAYIANENGFIFDKDTTIYYCNELNYQFRANLKDLNLKEFITLYKGKIWVNKSGSEFNITEPGTYFYVFKNDNCIDTSFKVTFVKQSFKIATSDNELKFFTPSNETSTKNTLKISNYNSKEYLFDKSDFELDVPFEILNTFPINIQPNDTATIEIEFKPLSEGNFSDTLTIHSNCDTTIKVALLGTKGTSDAKLLTSLDSANLGRLIVCTYGTADTTVTLTNVGTEYIVLKKAFPDGDFKVNPYINNDTLLVGESRPYSFGTTTKNIGSYDQIIMIPWESELGVRDTARIRMKAIITRPLYTIIEDTLNFGKLSGCDVSKVDSIHIVNTGIIDITFEDDEFLDGLEIINKPIIVSPGDTATVYIRFKPTGSVSIDRRNKFRVIPGCSLLDEFYVIAEKTDGGYDIEMQETIDFGTFYSCENIDSTIYLDLDVINRTINGDISIVNVKVDNNFVIDIDNVNPITNSSLIPVRFNKNIEGEYNSTVTIQFEPCGIEKEVVLKSKVLIQTIEYDDSISFDAYEQGSSSTKQLTIKNTNEDLLELSSIKLPNGFSFLNAINFPIILKKDSTITIEIVSSLLSLGDYIDTVSITTISPCIDEYAVEVYGTVIASIVPPGEFIAEFGINGIMKAPKNSISIPVLLNESIYKYDEVDIESISLVLDYPYNALMLKDIESKQNNLIVNSSDKEGRLTLDIVHTNNEKFKIMSNELLNLYFYILDVKPDDYSVKLVDGSTNSFPNMSVETEDSMNVTITENCVNTTDYRFTKPVSLDYILNDNFLSISLIQPTDDSYKLSIFNITGTEEKLLLDGNQSRGDYNISVNISNLSTGVYYLVLNYTNNVITKRISIIK